MEEVRPIEGEPYIVKGLPNAFANTDLDVRLRRLGRPEVIFVGAQTHMCVSATVRAALDLGWRSTMVADACATRNLPASDGSVLSAVEVQRTALAELADAFAIVVDLDAALEEGPRAAYIGFDATADSLHVGHLLQLMSLRWLQACGHRMLLFYNAP